MSTHAFKKIMKAAGKKPMHVALETGLGLSTVLRFLKGRPVYEKTELSLQAWANRQRAAK